MDITCRVCLKEKPVESFSIDLKARNGRAGLCRSCKNESAIAYRQRFAEEHGHSIHEGYFLHAASGALERYDTERTRLMAQAKGGCSNAATVLWDRWNVRITPTVELQDTGRPPDCRVLDF